MDTLTDTADESFAPDSIQPSADASRGVYIGADAIGYVMDVYERGLTLDALKRADSIAPLRAWRGPTACALAARIAANAGAPGLATWVSVRSYRRHPNDLEALVQFGYELFGRRGPFALWRKLQTWQRQPTDAAAQVAEILALQARAAALLRDFAIAETLLDEAETLDPARPWIRLQRAHWLQYQDRIEDALAVAVDACALHPHPFYRPGTQQRAYLLQMLDRDEDAIDLLRAAERELQSAPIAGQLYSLLSENNRWTEAEVALERFVSLSPLIEAPAKRWVAAQRAWMAYQLGRRAAAARHARELDDEFHKLFAERLTAPPPERERAQLDVQFVRQHFKTCAPATMASLGRFFAMPAEQVKIVEAICYDGTPAWRQREWAEQNGWCVREFRVTYDIVIALIERGIPFAISTVDATSAHMMAVVGFDRTRGTLLLRDPSQPYHVEPEAETFFRRYRGFGPRGMVFVPQAAQSRLQRIDLPEADLYDAYYRLTSALGRHHRADAAAALRELEQLDADAALTWDARVSLAYYDGNEGEAARGLEKLLALSPGDPGRQLQRFNCMPESSREERVALLRSVCAAKDADPALLIALARALQIDARNAPEVLRLMQRVLRLRHFDSSAIGVLADQSWDAGRFAEATDYYRFAANLEGFQERLYQSWFTACRQTGRAEPALQHLYDRFERFGARSEQPALTLVWALIELERPARAREVLERAIALRPDDGALRLRAAPLLADAGDTPSAERLLSEARGRVHESDWLRARMQAAENALDFPGALTAARELRDREPLALDAQATVARVLARLHGAQAARDELKGQSARFPHHYGLRRMQVEWSYDAGLAEWERAVRHVLEREPADAWARRELALALSRQQRGEEALIEAAEAARIEPANSYSWSVLGNVYRSLGRIDEARVDLIRAIERSADNTDAMRVLLDLARNDAERREDLQRIERELVRQTLRGDGLLTYIDVAAPVLGHEALLRVLRAAHAERPDLWHAWSALSRLLGQASMLDEALTVAQAACERFPHIPRLWLDLARIHGWRGAAQSEIEAARKAFGINPSWTQAAVALAGALLRDGQLEAARDAVQSALRHSPREAQLHAWLADLQWRLRDSVAAFTAVERALRLSPGYEWPWDLITDWAAQSGDQDRAAIIARALTQERPGEARVWMMFAKVATQPELRDQRLAAVERAVQLEPGSTENWDMKAQYLAKAERFDDAIRACEDGLRACHVDTHILRGRLAWIDSLRNRRTAAIAAMRAVVAEQTGYTWGWYQLYDWLLESGDRDGATAALERLQQLLPHDPWVSRQLGFLRLNGKDRAGARQAFAQAFAVAPDDTSAAHNLFDLQLSDGDLAGAAATLRNMQLHQPGAATGAVEIQLRLRERDRSGALEALKTLCASPDSEAWPLNAAADAFAEAGAIGPALKIVRRAVRSGDGNPQCAVAAIKLLLVDRRLLAAVWLFARLPEGEMQRRAAVTMLSALATGEKKWRRRLALNWLLRYRRDVLYDDDAAWGQAGFALVNFNRFKRVVDWLSNWRERNGVQPWMLFNLCLALRNLGRFDEATEVARVTVARWEHRDGGGDMYLFIAIEAAMAGHADEAESHLKKVAVRQDVRYDRQMTTLTKALIEFHRAPPGEQRECWRKVRADLGVQFPWETVASLPRDERVTFARAGKVFGARGAISSAWWWFNARLYWPWALVWMVPITVLIFDPEGFSSRFFYSVLAGMGAGLLARRWAR